MHRTIYKNCILNIHYLGVARGGLLVARGCESSCGSVEPLTVSELCSCACAMLIIFLWTTSLITGLNFHILAILLWFWIFVSWHGLNSLVSLLHKCSGLLMQVLCYISLWELEQAGMCSSVPHVRDHLWLPYFVKGSYLLVYLSFLLTDIFWCLYVWVCVMWDGTHSANWLSWVQISSWESCCFSTCGISI